MRYVFLLLALLVASPAWSACPACKVIICAQKFRSDMDDSDKLKAIFAHPVFTNILGVMYDTNETAYWQVLTKVEGKDANNNPGGPIPTADQTWLWNWLDDIAGIEYPYE
jgi:hypothetical protein